ncbi:MULTISPECIES: hypothetical protein [unclassified Sphingobacterium]|uniref:hypothetical protein n=1 Tax=unclassified Sphingobacterium TaxID=2609468 RepID=UPI00105306FD|nr:MULTISPECIES: hypothetical protein [unclassified Sphingobacterium]MCS3552744.1 hypothetical protein [Sphingobacterium sp. JUb21]
MIKLIKKYLVAIVAVGIAGTSLMAAEWNKESKTALTEPPLFWYKIDASGNIGSLENLNPSVPQSKTESMPGGSKQITPCDDTSTEVCLRGYESPQTTGSPAGPALSADHRINQN